LISLLSPDSRSLQKPLLLETVSPLSGVDMTGWLEWFTVALLSMSPISELRGAIPAGIAMGLDPAAVFAVAVIFNTLVFLPVYYGLEYTYDFFSRRWGWVRRLVEGIRDRRKGILEKYGLLGIVLFVAVPLPVTGAWTGTLLAWLFIKDVRRAWPAVFAGVLISGTVVITVTLLGVKIFA